MTHVNCQRNGVYSWAWTVWQKSRIKKPKIAKNVTDCTLLYFYEYIWSIQGIESFVPDKIKKGEGAYEFSSWGQADVERR